MQGLGFRVYPRAHMSFSDLLCFWVVHCDIIPEKELRMRFWVEMPPDLSVQRYMPKTYGIQVGG